MQQSAFTISQLLNEIQVLKGLPKKFDVRCSDGLFEIKYDNKVCAYFNIGMGKLFVEVYSPENWSLSIQSKIVSYLKEYGSEMESVAEPIKTLQHNLK